MNRKTLRVDKLNALRVTTENSPRVDSSNSIIVSDEQLHEIVLLSQQYDFEQEIARLGAEIRKLEKELYLQKQIEAAMAAAAAAEWHDAQQAQTQAAVDSFTARFSMPSSISWGSPQHRAVGGMYVISQQARALSGTPGFSPSPLQRTAMRFFPG